MDWIQVVVGSNGKLSAEPTGSMKAGNFLTRQITKNLTNTLHHKVGYKLVDTT
jgi:hypothetical protein